MDTFHNTNEVTTRKPHTCEWCGRRIPAGERAVKFSGRGEDFYYGYSHIDCERLIYKLNMFDNLELGEGLSGDMWCEYVREAWQGIEGNANKNNPPFSTALEGVKAHYLT